MYSKKLLFSILIGVSLSTYALAYERPQENLQDYKNAIIQYHESGQYEKDVAVVADRAKVDLAKRIAANKASQHPQKLAMVLDIDETSLSNYSDRKVLAFGGTKPMILSAEAEAHDVTIMPTLKLYQYAEKNGVTVFFVTGRQELYRKQTIKNLVDAGYSSVSHSIKACQNEAVNGHCTLYFRSGTYLNTGAIPFKTAMRRKIEAAGYKIVINIGDQESDLKGGYSEKTYKYPNFMYFIP